ncbi:hypothetical protein [Hymenobacter fodinae]|uniref:CBM-cenC domain-containing protein n=1 Tax=Hymenobacter fodinae TaxID=2510796 RepID=A0A4Z0P247_9BACT|nr:hypothetical protein [Hymenobacter fodinae]TGE05492.1 hypothetical protein EU556_19510 [Hymenobacter fodinae]
MKRLSYVAAFALLTACASGEEKKVDPKVLTSTSFEELAGWGGLDTGLLTKTRAHTGQYCIKVDNTHEFSLTYDVVLGEMSPRKVKKINLHAWVLLPTDRTNAILGIQVVDPANGQPVFGDGVKMETIKKYNKWVEIDKDFELPETIQPTHHLKLFLYRDAAFDSVYADDITLKIVD